MRVGQKRKTVKNGGNPPFFVLSACGLCIVLPCVVLFLVLVHGIGGSDRFSEIVRSVSLVVICGYNTGRAQMHRLWRAARTPPFFYAHEPQGLPGKT